MGVFQTTRWSLVLEAGREQAGPALETLCRVYRPPVLAYVRHLGHAFEDAEDLAQDFFLGFLEGALAARADPSRGRFRSFLLASLKHFLANAGERSRAAKRGGGVGMLGLEAAEGVVDAGIGTPERAFEISWALTVLERALDALRGEAERSGRLALFERVRPFLTETPDDREYTAAAAALGMRSNSLAVAVHRMRQRLRDRVRAELLDTLDDPTLLDEEMRLLRQTLAGV